MGSNSPQAESTQLVIEALRTHAVVLFRRLGGGHHGHDFAAPGTTKVPLDMT